MMFHRKNRKKTLTSSVLVLIMILKQILNHTYNQWRAYRSTGFRESQIFRNNANTLSLSCGEKREKGKDNEKTEFKHFLT